MFILILNWNWNYVLPPPWPLSRPLCVSLAAGFPLRGNKSPIKASLNIYGSMAIEIDAFRDNFSHSGTISQKFALFQSDESERNVAFFPSCVVLFCLLSWWLTYDVALRKLSADIRIIKWHLHTSWYVYGIFKKKMQCTEKHLQRQYIVQLETARSRHSKYLQNIVIMLQYFTEQLWQNKTAGFI